MLTIGSSASPEVGSKYCDAQVAGGAADYYLGRGAVVLQRLPATSPVGRKAPSMSWPVRLSQEGRTARGSTDAAVADPLLALPAFRICHGQAPNLGRNLDRMRGLHPTPQNSTTQFGDSILAGKTSEWTALRPVNDTSQQSTERVIEISLGRGKKWSG